MTYANVMATAAVFLALGGGAYAAKVAKNSVGASQIKKNAVAASEIKANAVGASEIAENAVGASETAAGSVGAAEVIDGSVGTAEVATGSLLGADVAANTLGGAQINEATLFNDDSLTGADINESTLGGLPDITGGVLTTNGTDTLALAEGSLTYTCSNPSSYSNTSGATSRMIGLSGDHNDVAGGSEVIFAAPTLVADGATSDFVFLGHWFQGAIVTDDNVALFEIWQRVEGGDCYYAMAVNEVPAN